MLNLAIRNYLQQLTAGLYRDGYELQLEEVCKKLGLKCYLAEFEDERTSGAIMKDENGQTYSIYVNRHHHPNRRRFTVAHEIGHYVSAQVGSYSKEELENEGFEDYAVSLRSDNTSPAETEANEIAAEMLMPQDKVRELFALNISIEEMARTFYVSEAAMTIRLENICGPLMLI